MTTRCRSGRMRRYATLFLMFAATVSFALVVAMIAVPMRREARERAEVQRQIVHVIPPAELVAACETIHANRGVYRQDASWHLPSDEHPDPRDPAMPATIRGLEPAYVEVGEETVLVEFGGGFEHVGMAWSKDDAGPPPEIAPIVVRQLAPNLWYYSETGTVPAP